jgi:Ca-activated chloride channel family protein
MSMRRPDTTPPRSRPSTPLLFLLISCAAFLGGQNPPPQQPAGQAPPPTAGGKQSSGQELEPGEGGVFKIKKEVQEVVLHATVVDEKQRLVTNLDRNAFTVYEDGQPQQITSFRREDIPVAMGIVIDNSGSMSRSRAAVNQAALNLVRASNPQDQVFIVNFADEYFLDQDFTSNIGKLQEALEKIESRGGTALYDALIASADHLKTSAKLDKKVLLVVTDGEDNRSRDPLEQAVGQVALNGGPTIYAIGIQLGGEKVRRAKRALQVLAEQTGGIAFFPKSLDEVDTVSQAVAHDIRNQYTIGYKPANPQRGGGYRSVRVVAQSKGYKNLQVRTRSGYYATQQRAEKQPDPR